MDPALTELLLRSEEADEDPVVEAIVRLRQPGLEVPGVRMVSRFGTIATCRLAASAIREVRRHPNVASLKAPRLLGPEYEPLNRDSAPIDPMVLRPTDVRRPPGLPLTGAGVVVGVVDWGLDIDHPNFKNPDGTTRLLALWDQANNTEVSPQPYGYGTVHSRDQINAALHSSQPYERLRYHPARADRGGGAHGTHVLDIAAGNGRAAGSLVGIAPQADLVFVDLADRDTGGLANLGGSVRLCEGVAFCARIAGTRPWVINLSIGRHGGPHDGTTLTELGFDELLDAAPGRFIVQSTGNYYRAGVHASGELATGQSQTLQFDTDPRDITDNELEIWYDGDDEFAVSIEPPGGIGPVVRLGTRADLVVDGQLVGRVHHRAGDPNNGDNHVDAFLYAPARAGSWTVTVYAVRARTGRFDAWLERDEACPGCQARFIGDDRDPTCSTGTIANSRLPLIVGAYDGHQLARPVARFSSRGPTRDGRGKPDVGAPGVGVLAARSAPVGALRSPGAHVRKSGSSMATPHVTGAVALCLQAAGHRLSARRIRALVSGTADAPLTERERLGRGYLNIPALITAVRENLPDLRHGEAQKEPVMDIDREAVLPLMLAPATAYRELLYRPGGELSRWIGERFEILARPGRTLTDPPRPGDVLLTVTLGQPGAGACGVLTDANLTLRRSAPGAAPGWYCTTTGAAARRRRIVDLRRVVPPGQLLLRVRPTSLAVQTEEDQHAARALASAFEDRKDEAFIADGWKDLAAADTIDADCAQPLFAQETAFETKEAFDGEAELGKLASAGTRALRSEGPAIPEGLYSHARPEPSGLPAEVATEDESAPDKAKNAIRAASAGWGTDERAILSALTALTPSGMAELSADASIIHLLNDELSGADLARVSVQLARGRVGTMSRTDLGAIIAAPARHNLGVLAAAYAREELLAHHEAFDRTGTGTVHGNRCGLPKPAGAKLTDCTTYALDVLEKAFASKGQRTLWNKVISEANKQSGGHLKGTEVLKALQTVGGWEAVFWAPDPRNPQDGQSEHPVAYKKVREHGLYYGITVDKSRSVINYRRTNPAHATDNTGIAHLRRLQFGALAARGGMHVAVIINGDVHEVHWDKPATDRNAIEATPLERFAWQSGVIATPPTDLGRAWQTP